MNNQDKVLLIKELNQLNQQLEHRKLTLFETAKYKKRLRDIYQLCDEPIFQKQILAFKAITQPEIAAYDFARNTSYSLSFRGFFIYDEDLENALYQQPDTGWALLHHPQKGWQIWLIPATQRTALISEWSTLTETKAWLNEQQNIYHCLTQDQDLTLKAVILQAEIKPVPTTITIPSPIIEDIHHAHNSELTTAVEDTQGLVDDESLSIHLADWAQAQLQLLDHPHASFKKLYQMTIQGDQAKIHDYVQCIACYKNRVFDLSQPLFIAEQTNKKQQFQSYLIIFGAYDQEHAFDLLESYNTAMQQSSHSLKMILWADVQTHLDSIEHLFHCVQKAPTLWKKDHSSDFIPRHLLHTKKFLAFHEKSAHLTTPILLLKERQKIRVIHGEKRLCIQPEEIAYPFLMLNRQDGFSWQVIQATIDQLPHPVDVQQLYQTLIQENEN